MTAFEEFGEVAVIARKLGEPDADARRVAVLELVETADPGVIPFLATALLDPSNEVRHQAAVALGEFDGPEAAAALLGALIDPHVAVAEAAADSLVEYETRGSRPRFCRSSVILTRSYAAPYFAP